MQNPSDPMLDLRGAPSRGLTLDDDPGMTFGAFTSILKYVALILLAPVITFFAAKTALAHTVAVAGDKNDDSVAVNVISAISAVVVLHVALGLFIYKAYFEGSQPKQRLGKQE